MRARVVQIGERLSWRARVRWYNVTMRRSYAGGEAVEVAATTREIAERLSFGNAYKPDPWGGKLDVLRHPRRVQRWINDGKKVGDCDEHAGYWIACLLKSGLARRVYFATMQMCDNATAKVVGHAVVVYLSDDLEWFTTDYDVPHAVASFWDWTDVYARKYNATILTATLSRAVNHDPNDDTFKLIPVAFRRLGGKDT